MPADCRQDMARFAHDASVAARPLIDAGLTFNYHNHSFELERFDGRTGLQILAEESDPEVFSFEVDTYWIQHGGGNPVSCLRWLKDRMHIVHLKDLFRRLKFLPLIEGGATLMTIDLLRQISVTFSRLTKTYEAIPPNKGNGKVDKPLNV